MFAGMAMRRQGMDGHPPFILAGWIAVGTYAGLPWWYFSPTLRLCSGGRAVFYEGRHGAVRIMRGYQQDWNGGGGQMGKGRRPMCDTRNATVALRYAYFSICPRPKGGLLNPNVM